MTTPPRPRPAALVLASALAAATLLVAGLVALAPPARADGASWQWPLRPEPEVLAGFVAPVGAYGPGHRGADLAATVGEPVHAAGDGVVAFAGRVAGRGVVSVAHPDGRRTTYEPVTASLPAGTALAVGDVLGVVSAAPGHCLPATCLHWGLRAGDTYQDPLSLLGVRPVRLLPVWGPQAATPPPAVVAPTGPQPRPDRGPLLAAGRGG